MTTITVNTSFDVAAGTTLNFTNENGFLLQEQASDPTLTIEGAVNVSSSTAGGPSPLTGILIGDSGLYNAPVTIAASGSLHVTSSVDGESVRGDFSNSWSPAFTNNGTFVISGVSDASGL